MARDANLTLVPFYSQESSWKALMDEQKKEDWLQLCALAANEQDPKRLFDLIRQINHLLEEREKKLKLTKQTETS